jgi:serralysin
MAYTYDHTNNDFDGEFWLNGIRQGAGGGQTGPITVTQDGYLGQVLGHAPLQLNTNSTTSYAVAVNGQINMNNSDGYALQFFSGLALGGNDKLTIGTTGIVTGGVGIFSDHSLTLKNAGRVFGVLPIQFEYATSHTSSITNSGTIESLGSTAISISGLGKHTITNSGTILGNILTGDGNEIVKNSGTISGSVDLGGGDDSYSGSAKHDEVYDGQGADKYSLGAGNDHFFASNFSPDTLVDTVDGGGNDKVDLSAEQVGDIYDAGGSDSKLIINLDSKKQTDAVNGTIVAGGVAGQASLVTARQPIDPGFDKIKGFESAVGGGNDDLIFGNGGDNYIAGSYGNDIIYGGAGKDLIYGDSGTDKIFGDVGADLLHGGGDADTFVYRQVKDSTVALAFRDTIFDFEDGDKIDLSAFHMATSGDLVRVDEAFSGNGGNGQIRVLTTLEGYTIQIDFNSDKKADMAIDVDMSGEFTPVTWDVSDFIF